MTPHDRIRQMNRDVANIRSTLAILERLIAPAIIGISNASGDGYSTRGDGPGNGPSDPVGAAIARSSDAIELDYQLKISWTVLSEMPNQVANLLRRAQTLTPRAQSVVSACSSGLHMAGYGVWGRKDTYGAPVRCDEIGEADRDGLCLGCARRRSRWKAEERVAS